MLKTKTVDDIPYWLNPIYYGLSYLVAALMIVQTRFHRATTRIEFEDLDYYTGLDNCILSVWHEDLSLFFMIHRKFEKPHIWMTLPLWYMKPIHIIKGWMGIRELAYGASGIDGKKALDQIVHRLEEGWSTFISPDGPAGPLKEVKNGILLMGLKSGLPIIPIFFHSTRFWRIPSWDRKKYPFPGGRLVVKYGPPIYVHSDNFEEAKKSISSFMTRGAI